MIQLQQLLQREKSHKEVAALLQQHLDVRPVLPSSYSVISQATAITAGLALVAFMFQFFHRSAQILPPTLSLIVGTLILIMAVASLGITLLLPARYQFAWYVLTLHILSAYGGVVGCFTLAFYLLPGSDYFIGHDRAITTLFAGLLAWAVVSLCFLPFLLRKTEKVSSAQARADLAQTHLALEQIMLTQKHLLKRLKNEKNQTSLEKATQADIPRFYLARHPDGTYTVAFKDDLPVPLMLRLAEMQPKTAFSDHEAIKRILEEDAPCEDIWTGSIYTFPETDAPQDYPGVTHILMPWYYDWEAEEQKNKDQREEDEEDEETPEQLDVGDAEVLLLASIIDERIVVACRAQKINDVAAEAWVQPEPSDRNEARQVALAWASTMRHGGKIPFFSHHNDDEGAADLARGLGLSLVVEEVDYY